MGSQVGAGAVPRRTGGRRLGFPSARVLRRIGISLCVALLIALVYSYVSLLVTGGTSPKQTDFVPSYSSAHLVLAGHGARVYDFPTLAGYERHLVHPLKLRDGIMPFLYPPFVAMALAPLAALPLTAAFILWTVINIALFLVTLAALARYAGFRGDSAVLFWALSLSFLPAFVAVTQGQTSMLLLAAFTAAILAMMRGHPVLAGLALSVGLVKPPYVVPFLLVLLVRRQWPALAAFVGFAAILVLVPTVLLGWGADTGYVDTMVKAAAWRNQLGFAPEFNHSFEGFARLILGAPVSTVLTYGLDVAVLAVLGWYAYRSRELLPALALAAMVALLVSPHVLVHDLSFLLIPAALAVLWPSRRTFVLPLILSLGYVVTLVNLRFVSATHVQVSVIAMCAFGAYVLWNGGRARGGLAQGELR